jgi:hypothetical protein
MSIGADREDDGIWIYGLAGSFIIIINVNQITSANLHQQSYGGDSLPGGRLDLVTPDSLIPAADTIVNFGIMTDLRAASRREEKA